MAVAQFHDPLVLRAYKKDRWKLEIPFRYTTLIFGKPVNIDAPKGFITDLASIPKIVRSLIPQVGKHRGAAVIHDYLYNTAAGHDYTRAQCDAVFLEAMGVAGVSWWKRNVMWAAVRSGGWIFFNKRRSERDI